MAKEVTLTAKETTEAKKIANTLIDKILYVPSTEKIDYEVDNKTLKLIVKNIGYKNTEDFNHKMMRHIWDPYKTNWKDFMLKNANKNLSELAMKHIEIIIKKLPKGNEVLKIWKGDNYLESSWQYALNRIILDTWMMLNHSQLVLAIKKKEILDKLDVDLFGNNNEMSISNYVKTIQMNASDFTNKKQYNKAIKKLFIAEQIHVILGWTDFNTMLYLLDNYLYIGDNKKSQEYLNKLKDTKPDAVQWHELFSILNAHGLFTDANEALYQYTQSEREEEEDVGNYYEGGEEDYKYFTENILSKHEQALESEKKVTQIVCHNLGHHIAKIKNDYSSILWYLNSKDKKTSTINLIEDAASDINFGNTDNMAKVLERCQENISVLDDTLNRTKVFFNVDEATINKKKTNLIKYLENIVDSNSSLYYKSLTNKTGKKNIPFMMDAKLFNDMLINIFNNAEKHGFKEKTKNRIKFELKINKKNQIELLISNNGFPFPEGFTLEDYIRWGSSRGETKGSGIGGAFTNKVVELHNGELSLPSRKKGVCIKMIFNKD